MGEACQIDFCKMPLNKQLILKRIISPPLTFYRNTNRFFNRLFNWIVMNHKKVSYSSFPVIKGRIKLYGEGRFVFGKAVKFNCSLESNFVGLFKTCTVAVLKGAELEIGDHSGFSGVSIYCERHIKIGAYVNCGGNVSIWDTDFHPLNHLERRVHNVAKTVSEPVVIGDDVFIGANSIVLKGVTIGHRSIIGAGSVVSKNIPADEIWAGNPIKFIKRINEPI